MQTDAQKKASKKYVSENVKVKTLKLFPKDSDIIEHLEQIDMSFGEYVRKLIREDMERNR